MRTPARWLALGVAAILPLVGESYAYYLDDDRNFDVRLRAYSQLGIMTESSGRTGCPDPRICPPQYSAGDLAQHRNFYNPEFDAKLTSHTRWMQDVPGLSLVMPDDFKFRFAWWGFYDGLYDYLDGPWNDNRRNLKARLSQTTNPARESYSFDDENKDPRGIYAHRNRINELYLDYTKGRFFVRVGRQAISWGESDSIALHDVMNPFDLTLAAPGFFQDVDEARIPLWTFRSTIKLVDNWRFLSGLFADMYLVPGIIDTTVPINPLVGGVSPFNPDVADPIGNVSGQTVPQGPGQPPLRLHVITADRLPENTWANSRWGVRLAGVLFRDYTVQGWFFRTYNQAPVPILPSPGAVDLLGAGRIKPTLIDDRGFRTPVCNNVDATTGFGRTPAGRPCSFTLPAVSILERRLESVVGLAATWYSPLVNGIIRTQAQFFIDELGFIPEKNLNARSQLPAALLASLGGTPVTTSIPRANILRWVLGYDRFFFFRPLNPTNSFVLSTAFNGSFNFSERQGMDFRNPQPKPGKLQATFLPRSDVKLGGAPLCTAENIRQALSGENPLLAQFTQFCIATPNENFENANKFEGFLQTALQTDFMHGKLSPRIVVITDVSGIFGFAPQATYRVTDNLLLTGIYLAIDGSRQAGLATFRRHDMVQLRVTYQLN
jgi:hypothetical protein